jgi:hypothetical protein
MITNYMKGLIIFLSSINKIRYKYNAYPDTKILAMSALIML